MKAKRNEKILLKYEGGNRFALYGKGGRDIASERENYKLYFKNVNFRSNGNMEGNYLGEDYSAIMDNHCREIFYDADEGQWYYSDTKAKVRTAKLVAFENKKNVIIVISSK